MAAILDETARGAVLFPDIGNLTHITVSYPTDTRELGEPIQVSVDYYIEPLTPLFRFISFGTQGRMHVYIAAQRAIESMGSGPPTVAHPDGVVCSGHD
jgi:hypothetical protein